MPHTEHTNGKKKKKNNQKFLTQCVAVSQKLQMLIHIVHVDHTHATFYSCIFLQHTGTNNADIFSGLLAVWREMFVPK
jgi:hypothetical protein